MTRRLLKVLIGLFGVVGFVAFYLLTSVDYGLRSPDEQFTLLITVVVSTMLVAVLVTIYSVRDTL